MSSWALIGFLLAAYSIVANDAIQTLGTFLSSNRHRGWVSLWLYACSILAVVILYGWWRYGDASYGRLEAIPPVPEVSWIFAIPPLAILVLTRLGIPVSTSFLILTVFAPSALGSMLNKSVLGYTIAFAAGAVIYLLIAWRLERIFKESDSPPKPYWVWLQFISTGLLWSQWLIQDLANILVYLPRQITLAGILGVLAILFALHAFIFYRRGGEIQKIVTSKTQTADIRSATIIDFVYAGLLFFFTQLSNIPMSTTWVFIGLLAGREIGINLRAKYRPLSSAWREVAQDVAKAGVGLGVSVLLALGLPYLAGGQTASATQASLVEESLPDK